MPWDNDSPRHARLPKDWHARRARTERIAGKRCQRVEGGQRCTWTSPPKGSGQPGGHADHIDRTKGDEQSNLEWLCPTHHKIKTSAEGHAAAAAARSDALHPVERHPGLS